MLRGWSGYFGYGTRLQAYRAVDAHVYGRVRNFLVKRHKVQGRGTRTSRTISCSGSSACCTSSACTLGHAVGLETKPVGEPDAGNRHVRFDERGEETERWSQSDPKPPRLSSTLPVASHATRKAATKRLDWRNILVSKQSARVTHRIRRRHGRSYAVSPGPVTRLDQVAHSRAGRRQPLLERRACGAARGGPSPRPRRGDRRSAPRHAQPAPRHPLLSGDGDGTHDGDRRRLRGCRRPRRAAP